MAIPGDSVTTASTLTHNDARGNETTLAAAIAIMLLVILFFFGRLTRDHYIGAHSTSAPRFMDSSEPDTAVPSTEHPEDPAQSLAVPMPGDAGIVDDAAGTTGSKPVRRIAEAPSDVTSPGDLTIEDYRRKHKLLDEDRVAGNLTKEEFNDLLAELWSCVRK